MSETILTRDQMKSGETMNQVYGIVAAIETVTGTQGQITTNIGNDFIYFLDNSTGKVSSAISRPLLEAMDTYSIASYLQSFLSKRNQWSSVINDDIKCEFRYQNNIPGYMNGLKVSLISDEDYRRAWQDNIAMAFVDAFNGAGCAHVNIPLSDIANKAADDFIKSLMK